MYANKTVRKIEHKYSRHKHRLYHPISMKSKKHANVWSACVSGWMQGEGRGRG
jgi:hypothetical protein